MKKSWYTFLLLFVLLLGLAPVQQALQQYVSAATALVATAYNVEEEEEETSKIAKIQIGIGEFLIAGLSDMVVYTASLRMHQYRLANSCLVASPSVEIHVPPPNIV